jgi:RNA polymerase sigma-70 factor (ECF subfamily)
MSGDDLQQVIRQAQAGDEAAVALLYETHIESIYRYVRHRLPTTADAEDVTAEVFLNMVQGLANYRYTGVPFKAWLYRIASARIADFYRQRQRRPEADLSDSLRDGAPLPEEQLQRQQEIEQLQEALKQLSEDQQMVLFLRFRERKSHDEVARILGKSAPAVRSDQHRALSRLAALLGSEGKARSYLRGTDG